METKIASLWSRVGGALIDLIIVFVVSSIILFIWGFLIGFNGTDRYLTAEESSILWKGRGMLVGIIVDGILTTVLMAGERQATFGQRAVGIKIIKDDGTKLGYDTAIGRWIVSLFSSVLLKIGFAIAIFSDRKKTLHDLLAGTVVVKSEEVEIRNLQTNTSETKIEKYKPKKQNKSSESNDEHIYEQAYEELHSEKRKKGLYIKILTNNNGDKELSETEYIRKRVEQIKSDNDSMYQRDRKIKLRLNSKPVDDELLAAVKRKDSYLASELLRKGKSYEGTDDDGYTLMEIAITNKDNTMQRLLNAYGAKKYET